MTDYAFGYCTNVHAGVTLEQAQENLLQISARVRQLVAPKGRLPVGLWLAEQAARQLSQPDQVQRLAEWLEHHGLKPYTFNGFPQGDFHQSVVKHAVYEPTWLEQSRLHYTQALADILAGLLPRGQTGSISTLPLGWPHSQWQPEQFQRAGQHLQRLAEHLDQLCERTDCEIVVAIEPEPGCVLDTAPKMVDFLHRYVLDPSRPYIARHITICHDICHSAVMFESQGAALDLYRANQLRIGKVQVSSAIEVPWPGTLGDSQGYDALAAQLRTFNEPRYLHQTTRLFPATGTLDMVEDLSVALQNWLPSTGALASTSSQSTSSPPGFESPWPETVWRIHFHVPIFVKHFGQLLATQADIAEVVTILQRHQADHVSGGTWFTGHYEVETYAWNVLPAELQQTDLAAGIARELQYFQSILDPL